MVGQHSERSPMDHVRQRSIYWSRETETVVRNRYRAMLDAWGAEHAEHSISTSQGQTFAITAGNPELPTVILLPGSMATSAMWLRTIDALTDRFHVAAVDIIGDAGFSAPSRPAMKSDAHARWLDNVLDALQVEDASFVGASLGGWLSLDYAIRRSSRVHRLALLAPAGIGRIRPGFMFKTAPLLFLGSWGHRKALGLDMGFSADDPRLEDAAFLQLFETVRSGLIARMQPIPVFPDRQLRQLNMPVLTIVGGRDVIFDSHDTKRRVDANVEQSHVILLPDAGHGLVDTTTMIRAFLLGTGVPTGATHAAALAVAADRDAASGARRNR